MGTTLLEKAGLFLTGLGTPWTRIEYMDPRTDEEQLRGDADRALARFGLEDLERTSWIPSLEKFTEWQAELAIAPEAIFQGIEEESKRRHSIAMTNLTLIHSGQGIAIVSIACAIVMLLLWWVGLADIRVATVLLSVHLLPFIGVRLLGLLGFGRRKEVRGSD